MEGDAEAAVARARAGDRDAFRALVEEHSRNVFRLAYRITGNEEDAEDVVQETFLKAYRSLGRFQGRSEFSTWLHRIAANCALDVMRRRSVRASEESSVPEPVLERAAAAASVADPERVIFGIELGREVTRSLSRLSPMERAAFVLRHFEGCPIREIAGTLGIRTGAAKNCVFRAVAKLRNDLAPLVESNA